MNVRTKIGVIAAGSVLVLAFAVASFRPFFNARSVSAMKVSLQDVSGKPLNSLFDGMPIDEQYPQLRRLLAERRPSRCGRRPSRAVRLLQEVGLWFEPVVHACPSNCGDCGYVTGEPIDYCSEECGGNPYNYNLMRSRPEDGIGNGTPRCKVGPPADCPGEVPTTDCDCLSGP